MIAKTRKETIEFNAEFLDKWDTYCNSNGYVKRQVAHAARLAFMELSATEREKALHKAMPMTVASRRRRRQ